MGKVSSICDLSKREVAKNRMSLSSDHSPDSIPAPWQISMPWLWFTVVVGGILLLCATPLIAIAIWRTNNAAEVRRLTTKIEAKGEPVTAGQLATEFSIPKGRVDVSRQLLDAMAPLSTGAFRGQAKAIPVVGTEINVAPKIGEPWPDIQEAERLLASNEFSLSNVDQAVQLGCYARFSLDYSKGHSTSLATLQDVRSLMRLLLLDFAVKAHKNDVAGATKSLRALLMMSRCCQQEPMLVAQLIRYQLDGVAKSSLADTVCLLNFDESDLLEFRAILQAHKPIDSLRTALLGERALGLMGMENTQLIDSTLPATAAFESDKVTYLIFMERYIAAIESGFPEALFEVENIDLELSRKTSGMSKLTAKMTMRLLANSSMLAAFDAMARDIATSNAADAGIAIELFRRQNRTLPKTLDELVPKHLSSIPLDPYSGASMRYRIDEKGFAIYSVGRNKTDDGGGSLDNQVKDVGLYFPVRQ